MFYVIYLLIVANDKFVFVSFLLVKSLNKEKNIKREIVKTSCLELFCEKGILKFFSKLTGKHLYKICF